MWEQQGVRKPHTTVVARFFSRRTALRCRILAQQEVSTGGFLRAFLWCPICPLTKSQRGAFDSMVCI